MPIYILDESVKIEVYFEENDHEFEDNVCISFHENCPEEERIYRANLSHIYISVKQARQFAHALILAAQESEGKNQDLAENHSPGY